MTIGIPHSLQGVLEVESGVEEKTAAAAKVLESQGARLTSVDLPPFKEWDAPRKAVVVSDMLALHRESGWFPQRASQYGDDTAAFLRLGERITGADLAVAHRTLRALRRRFMGVFEVVDVLVIPTTSLTAPSWKEAERTTVSAAQPKDSTFADARPLVPDVLRATGPIGWCGLVSVSVPSGFSSEGMPIGVQIVTRDESTALSAAVHYQSVTDFHRARPPIDQLATIQGNSARSTTVSRLPPSHRTEDQSRPEISHPRRG
jgi:aspartyl-tRNA(Asn)/glutamyl-tRNA(Gln) amidotransferase subunit A